MTRSCRNKYNHPPHILSPASHTITHLTSISPLPPPKSPPSSHFTGTQQDVTQLLFRGRKRVRVASYVSIGRSPLPFFPLSTSSTSLHIDYPPRTRYLFLSSPRTNALPLTPTSWAWGNNRVHVHLYLMYFLETTVPSSSFCRLTVSYASERAILGKTK